MNLLPLTEDVRRDLWQFFGASPEEAEARRNYPLFVDVAVSLVPLGRTVALRLDTPFGLAFSQWRDGEFRTKQADRVAVLVSLPAAMTLRTLSGPLPLLADDPDVRAACPVCGHPAKVRDGILCMHGPPRESGATCPGSGQLAAREP